MSNSSCNTEYANTQYAICVIFVVLEMMTNAEIMTHSVRVLAKNNCTARPRQDDLDGRSEGNCVQKNLGKLVQSDEYATNYSYRPDSHS